MNTHGHEELKFTPSKQHGAENELLPLPDSGCWVSFNPAPCKGDPLFESDGGKPETVLILTQYDPKKYAVLMGDHREGVLEAYKEDGSAGVGYYFHEKESTAGSSWSNLEDSDVMAWVRYLLGEESNHGTPQSKDQQKEIEEDDGSEKENSE